MKIKKYYSRFDEKPAFIIALGEYLPCLVSGRYSLFIALHPYYKLAYIELAWGGAKEQEAERRAGNPDAKNWQDEACKILEKTVRNLPRNPSKSEAMYLMTRYRSSSTGTHAQGTRVRAMVPCLPWRQKKTNQSRPNSIDTASASSPKNRRKDGRPKFADTSKIYPPTSQKIPMSLHGGRYMFHVFLSFFVTYYFQDNGSLFPTFRRVALDFLPCLASSVPCERLFSSGGEIATKRRAQLGAARFEELQVMKFAWRNDVDDLASWNSSQVEEVDNSAKEYEDLLVADTEQGEWDQTEDEISSL